jgi:protein SCO1/2
VILPIGSYLYLKYGLDYYTDRLEELGDLGQASTFELPNQMGDTVTLDDFKGKMQVVGYFSGDCGEPCDSLVSAYSRLQREFPNNNYKVNLFAFHSGEPAIDKVNNKEVGSMWYWLKGEKATLENMFTEGYQLDVQDGYSNQFALVDSSMTIRRLYDATDSKEIDRLIIHLAMTAPRPPKAAVKFKREEEK